MDRPRFQLLPKGRKAWIRAAIAVLAPILFFTFAGWYMTSMPGKSFSGRLPELTPEEAALAGRLRVHVTRLAGEIGDRSTFRPEALTNARRYIEEQFRAAGFAPGLHEYEAARQKFTNIIAELPGADANAGLVVVGAHYDTCDNPGANDNASGVAALLDLAGRFHGRRPRSTVRFVAFANEEPPFFQTEGMGSMAYARLLRTRGERVSAMLALETLGYYADQPGTQKYPGLIGLAYPDRGDFVAFVGDLSSRGLIRRCAGAFRAGAEFPSEGACLPGWIPGIGWSDHWSFRQTGFPGVMVTDTAPFRYPYYHQPQDTPDKLDYERLARVTVGLDAVIGELAGRR